MFKLKVAVSLLFWVGSVFVREALWVILVSTKTATLFIDIGGKVRSKHSSVTTAAIDTEH